MVETGGKLIGLNAIVDGKQTGGIIGVGTGSTANHFIDALAEVTGRIDGAVASWMAVSRAAREEVSPYEREDFLENWSVF